MPRTEATVEDAKIEELCRALTKGKTAETRRIDGTSSALSAARLQELAAKIRAQGNCPLVEDIEGDPKNKRVTFLYYDKSKESAKCGIAVFDA